MQKLDTNRLLGNFQIALEALWANKLRSLLTALGIIFGVAAVISMLAIGKGAQQEILAQIELIGVNNIIITPIVNQFDEDISGSDGGKEEEAKFSKGLDVADGLALLELIPQIERISPEIEINTTAIRRARRKSIRLIGLENDFFDLFNTSFSSGSAFHESHMKNGAAVCIIGTDIQRTLFAGESPIGKYIKCGDVWLKVIGVTQSKNISEDAIENLGIRNFNADVYIPLQTMLLRFRNRALVELVDPDEDEDEEKETINRPKNNNQIDKLTIKVSDSESLSKVASITERVLKRRHNGVVDFEISIPQELLRQQQRTKDIFNLVLSVIAGISLLVGGIGIMNIMLASVLERTKEIGTRLAIGARKTDVIWQFLMESVMISVTGGFLGILLGIIGAYLIRAFADINTILTLSSIVISFGVAVGIGLIFGISPARKAALQNPIESLRYE
ncbi:MAG: ABC transporter permease [Schleiferiaceae bacterium]|nr:ABC transporter permease [Schleiferiaceae bacterium]